jgi:acetylornithine deacetylase
LIRPAPAFRKNISVQVLSHILETLEQLLATPSVNPRLARCGEPQGEEQLTRLLVQFAAASGWRWGLQRVHPGRENFLALLPGGRGDTLLWDVHQDTVSSQGMRMEPFRATRRNGRVYGRGACDVKGPMAAMLIALREADRASRDNRPNILLACTVNEECGFTGARALAEFWSTDPQSSPAIEFNEEGGLTVGDVQRLRPNAALVAEPTEMNVVVAHRGVVRWQCTVHGRAAHSSRPEAGANAIYAMTHVVQAIEEYHDRELAGGAVDPLCGPATSCVTTIQGGTGPNTVPDRAVIDIDRRLRPDEIPETAYCDLIEYVTAKVGGGECRIQHDPAWMQSRGLARGANEAWGQQLAEIVRGLGVEAKLCGAMYGTDAASIAAAGIPTVVFGPGSIAQAHTADEWIAEEALERGVEAYYRVAMGKVKLTP